MRFRAGRNRFLENGPHVVEVTPVKAVNGRTGRDYERQRPVIVENVLVQSSAGNALKASETRTARKALIGEGTIRVIGAGNDWPGGPHSYIRVLEGPYKGREFQQSGEASYWCASPMTTHFSVRGDSLWSEPE